jgi:hypothetical protein
MSSGSGSIPRSQAPRTQGAKAGDELRESITAKAKEAEALILQAKIIMVTALDIQA